MMPYDSLASLKERLISYYSFSAYTCYHFEVSNNGSQTAVDEMKTFSEYDFIREGTIFYVVCDQYNLRTARENIKYTVAFMSGTLPLLGLLLQKQEEGIPECIKNYQKQVEAAKSRGNEPVEIKLEERFFNEEAIMEDQKLKNYVAKSTFPVRFDLESFSTIQQVLTKPTKYPIHSLSVPAYNPPVAARQLVGDLLYLRVGCAGVSSRGPNIGRSCFLHHRFCKRLFREPVHRLRPPPRGEQRVSRGLHDAVSSTESRVAAVRCLVRSTCEAGRLDRWDHARRTPGFLPPPPQLQCCGTAVVPHRSRGRREQPSRIRGPNLGGVGSPVVQLGCVDLP